MSIRVMVISEYPPVEGIPQGETSITAPFIRFMPRDEVDLLWVFPESSISRCGYNLKWREILNDTKVEYHTYSSHFNVKGLIRGVSRIWPPSVCLKMADNYIPQAKVVSTIIASFCPQVIHLTSPVAACLFYPLSGIPVVYVPFDSLSLGIKQGALGHRNGLISKLRIFSQKRMEHDLYQGKSVIVFVAAKDANFSVNMINSQVEVIPLGCDVRRFTPGSTIDKSINPTIIFIGDPRYYPNAEAINVIINDLSPKIWVKHPNVEFRFIGRGMPSYGFKCQRSDPRYKFIDYLDDLSKELRYAWLALYPLKSGSGMKNKVMDAMSSALPVVGFREAYSGLSLMRGVVLCDTVEECVSLVNRLISNSEERLRLGKEGREAAEELSWEKVCRSYVDLWNRVAKRN